LDILCDEPQDFFWGFKDTKTKHYNFGQRAFSLDVERFLGELTVAKCFNEKSGEEFQTIADFLGEYVAQFRKANFFAINQGKAVEVKFEKTVCLPGFNLSEFIIRFFLVFAQK
jgi:hypothetical protein